MVGGGAEGLGGIGAETVDREGHGVETGQDRGKTWTPRVVAVFIPPAVFEEMQAILDLPMRADQTQQIGGGHLVRVETGHVIADVVRNDLAAGRAQLAIHAQRDAAPRQVQRVTDVVGVL